MCTQGKDNRKMGQGFQLEEMQKIPKVVVPGASFEEFTGVRQDNRREGKYILGRKGHEPMSNRQLTRKQGKLALWGNRQEKRERWAALGFRRSLHD